MWLKTFHISHNSFAFGPAVARCRLCHSRTVTKVKTSVFVNTGLLNISDLTSGEMEVRSSMWSDMLGHTCFLCFLSWFIHPPATPPSFVRRDLNHPLITGGDLGNMSTSQSSKLKMSGVFCFRKTGFFGLVEGSVNGGRVKGLWKGMSRKRKRRVD